MDTLMKADIFFFISSISAVVLTIFAIIALYYLIRVLRDFSNISDTLKRGVDKASGHLDDLVDMLMGNALFRLFFGKKKTTRKNSKKD
ncbi:MAG: hypothetical protein ACKOW9_02055 [Candidatus Paceibacterota bacterium]